MTASSWDHSRHRALLNYQLVLRCQHSGESLMRFQAKNEDRYEALVGLRVAIDLAAESIFGPHGEEQVL